MQLEKNGEYIASESNFYRVLAEEKLNIYRSKTKEPVKRKVQTHIATDPNQVWTWDITCLNAFIKGKFLNPI